MTLLQLASGAALLCLIYRVARATRVTLPPEQVEVLRQYDELLAEIGSWSVDVAMTQELAPSRALAEKFGAMRTTLTRLTNAPRP